MFANGKQYGTDSLIKKLSKLAFDARHYFHNEYMCQQYLYEIDCIKDSNGRRYLSYENKRRKD
jgi:hypothetical protein